MKLLLTILLFICSLIASASDLTFVDEPFNGSALPSNWTNNGSSYTVSGGALNFSGAGSVSKYVRYNKGVLCERASIEITFTLTAVNTTDIGVFAGLESYNAFGYGWNMRCGYVAATGNSNFGKIQFSTTQGNFYSTASNTNVSSGDQFKQTITRNLLEVTVTVENITKGWTINHTISTTPAGSPFITPNSAYLSIYQMGGSVAVTNFKYIIHIPEYIDFCIIGDSITYGQMATTEPQRWASLVGDIDRNIPMGGGADYTASVVARLDEIVAIHPQRVLLMIGGNDFLFGISSATVQANLKTIRNTLAAAGIQVIHCYPTPRQYAPNVISIINSEPDFATDMKIDCNTPLMNGNASTLQSIYNSGDNLHPSTAGHAKVAEVINSVIDPPYTIPTGTIILGIIK